MFLSGLSACQGCCSSLCLHVCLSAYLPNLQPVCLLFIYLYTLLSVSLVFTVLFGGPAAEPHCKVLGWLEGTFFQWRDAASNILFVVGCEADLSRLLSCWHSDSLWLAAAANDTHHKHHCCSHTKTQSQMWLCILNQVCSRYEYARFANTNPLAFLTWRRSHTYIQSLIISRKCTQTKWITVVLTRVPSCMVVLYWVYRATWADCSSVIFPPRELYKMIAFLTYR